jgi:hypothetical protein
MLSELDINLDEPESNLPKELNNLSDQNLTSPEFAVDINTESDLVKDN